jgi:gamma-polyglutamate biosynthesis protein CapC
MKQTVLAAGILPLAIFPENGLAHSALPPIFVGLILLTFFAEAYGWVYTALIIPGYLAPVWIVHPWAGCVVVVEAVLTYFIVRALSDHLSRFGLWDDFFGRDRFFAFVLVSIAVRLICETWLFPTIGQAVVTTLGVTFDVDNRLHSVGFVIVPLLANVFWKPGIRRGFLPAAFVMASTYVVVRYVLIPYTNYSVARFDLLYEDVARGLDSGPKVYIMLVTGAWMASRVNLKYGWDMGGILVPTLLMLAWTTPTKILATAVEATLIAVVAAFILRQRFLESTTIEGPRRTLLVFSVGMLLKLIVGHAASLSGMGFRATDMYGFGYLLPTLLADKILTKNSLGIVMIPVLRTSLVGFIVANGIGYGLYVASDYLAAATSSTPGVTSIESRQASLASVLALDRARILPAEARNTYDKPLARDLAKFRNAFATLRDGEGAMYPEALAALADLDMHVLRVQDDSAGIASLVVRETGTPSRQSTAGSDRAFGADRRNLHGWGIYVLNENPRADIVIEAPRPHADPLTLDAAAALYVAMGARALIVAGAHPSAGRDGSSDVLREADTIYHEAHRAFLDAAVIQVRATSDGVSELWVKRGLPGEASDLRLLRSAIGDFRLKWEETGSEDIQRRDSRGSFVTLALSRAARRKAVMSHSQARLEVVGASGRSFDAVLEHIRSDEGFFAQRSSNLYLPPTMAELLYFDEAVLAPLVAFQQTWQPGKATDELDVVAVAAHRFDYALVAHEWDDSLLIVLREDLSGAEPRRYWGTYAFRGGEAEPLIVEIPRPVGEFGTMEMGVRLADELSARALFLPGAHWASNHGGATDWTADGNTDTVSHLAHQVMLRDYDWDETPLVAQLRGFRPRDRTWQTSTTDGSIYVPATRNDIVLSLGVETPAPSVTTDEAVELEAALSALGYTVGYFDGNAQHIAFAARDNAQLGYMTSHGAGVFAHVWVSSDVRERYRHATMPDSFVDLAVQLDLAASYRDIEAWLMARPEPTTLGSATTDAEFPEEFLRLARAYKRIGNAAVVVRLHDLARAADAPLSLVVDRLSGHAYLAAWHRGGIVVRMTGALAVDRSVLDVEGLDGAAFAAYARGDAEALIVRPTSPDG